MISLDDFNVCNSEKPIIAHGSITPPGILTPGRCNLNWSDIIDKLIRLSAKYTDYYASDALISINVIQKDIDAGKTKSEYYFGFRESGVDHDEYILQADKRNVHYYYRAVWRISVEHDIESNQITMNLQKVRYSPKNY